MVRPRKSDSERREYRKELWFNAIELSSFIAGAAEARMSPPDYARHRLCGKGLPGRHRSENAVPVDVTLEIIQIGKNLRDIADIAAKSEQLPFELPALLAKLDHLIERMIER